MVTGIVSSQSTILTLLYFTKLICKHAVNHFYATMRDYDHYQYKLSLLLIIIIDIVIIIIITTIFIITIIITTTTVAILSYRPLSYKYAPVTINNFKSRSSSKFSYICCIFALLASIPCFCLWPLERIPIIIINSKKLMRGISNKKSPTWFSTTKRMEFQVIIDVIKQDLIELRT